jgi:hypothetical protein
MPYRKSIANTINERFRLEPMALRIESLTLYARAHRHGVIRRWRRRTSPSSSGELFLRPAQQLHIELAAGEQHIIQRFADILAPDC